MKVGFEASDVNDHKLEALGRASESWCNVSLSESTSILDCFSGASHTSYIGAHGGKKLYAGRIKTSVSLCRCSGIRLPVNRLLRSQEI